METQKHTNSPPRARARPFPRARTFASRRRRGRSAAAAPARRRFVKELNLLEIECVSIISKQSTPVENAAVIPQLCTDITTTPASRLFQLQKFSTEFAEKIDPATMKPSGPSQSTIRKHNKACARLKTLHENAVH